MKARIFVMFSMSIVLFISFRPLYFDGVVSNGPEEAKPIQNTTLTWKFPTEPPLKSEQSAFDQYMWQLFVALNWPASASQRGVADTNKSIGDSGPVVWSTFKTSEQTFLEAAVNPGDWNDNYSLDINRSLAQTSKVDPEIVQLLSATSQAVGGTLTDQAGNLVFYEKFLNKVEYDFIVSNTYYNNDVLNQLTAGMVMPNNSTELKASWKILTSTDQPDRYYTATASIGDSTTTVGLVGLHITIKTANAPQWIWGTFEQIDNVEGENGGNAPYSFYDPNCTSCIDNQATTDGSATQVTRVTDIGSSADSLNQIWKSKLAGTPFANYQLISSQWPTDPHNPGNPPGNPEPPILANTTMETYIQANSSCSNCHGTARTSGGLKVTTDRSFLFLEAKSPN